MSQTDYKYVCGSKCSFSIFGWCPFEEAPVYCDANATTPEPTTYIAESYQNAYETAFEAEGEKALNSGTYPTISGSSSGSISIPSGNVACFINGTFGYQEKFENSLPVDHLIMVESYSQQPYSFMSAGSGGGNGYMYLD